MLYAFFGTDTVGVRSQAHEFVRGFEARGVGVVRITPEHWSAGVLEDAAGSMSLFGGEQLYIIDTPSGETEMFEYIFGNLDLLAESQNTFVLIEEKLLAPEKKKLQTHAAECVEVTATAAKTFNPFKLSDALVGRDKKSLWLLFHEAKGVGIPPEQISGLLFAALRSLRLSARAASADAAGQKPFVYGKNKRALQKFKDGEVDTLSRELVSIYHDGHLGKHDFDLALERWVLRL